MGEGAEFPARPFWDRVQHERTKRGWTQLQLQERSKIDRTNVHRMKTAKGLPLPETVLALASVLGIDRDEALELAGLVVSPAERALKEAIVTEVPSAEVRGDDETEDLLARIPVRRRALLERIRAEEQERLRRLEELAEAERAAANAKFADLVRFEADEADEAGESNSS